MAPQSAAGGIRTGWRPVTRRDRPRRGWSPIESDKVAAATHHCGRIRDAPFPIPSGAMCPNSQTLGRKSAPSSGGAPLSAPARCFPPPQSGGSWTCHTRTCSPAPPRFALSHAMTGQVGCFSHTSRCISEVVRQSRAGCSATAGKRRRMCPGIRANVPYPSIRAITASTHRRGRKSGRR